MTITDLQPGTVVRYRNNLYWIANGLDGRIAMSTLGHWYFLKELHWAKFEVVFTPDE